MQIQLHLYIILSSVVTVAAVVCFLLWRGLCYDTQQGTVHADLILLFVSYVFVTLRLFFLSINVKVARFISYDISNGLNRLQSAKSVNSKIKRRHGYSLTIYKPIENVSMRGQRKEYHRNSP